MPTRRTGATVSVSADVSKLKQGMREATRDTQKFGDAVDEPGAAMRRLDRNMDKVTRSAKSNAKAQRELSRQLFFMERRVNNLARGFTRLLAGLALGGGAFGATLTRLIETGDRIVKTADRLALTTEELTAFRYAADLAGISTRNFDLGFQRFSRRLGEALVGRGELAKPLIDLGIAIRNVDGSARSSLDVLKDFADEVQRLTSSGRNAEALALVFKGFDTEGVAFIELLRGGSEELAKIPALAEEAGVTISRELLDRLVQLKDAFTEVRAAVGTNLLKGVADLAPQIEQLVRAVGERLPGAVNRAARGFLFLADNIGTFLTISRALLALRLGLFFTNLVKGVLALRAALVAASVGAAGLLGPLALMVASFTGLTFLTNRLFGDLTDSTGAANALARASEDVRDLIRETKDLTEGFAATLGDAAQEATRVAAITRLTKRRAEAEAEVADLTERQAKAQANLQRQLAAAQTSRAPGAGISLSLANAGQTVEQIASDLVEAKADVTALGEELANLESQAPVITPTIEAVNARGLTEAQQALLDGALNTKVAVQLTPNFGGFNQIEARAAEAAEAFQAEFTRAASRFQSTGFLEGLDAGFDSLQDSTRALVANLSEVAEEAEAGFTKVQELGQAAFDSITSSATDFFTNFIAGTESAAEAFRRFVSDILSQWTRLALDLGFNAVRGSLFGGQGGGGAAAAALAPPSSQGYTVQVVNNFGTVDLSGDVQDQLDRQIPRIADLTVGAVSRALGSDTRLRRATRAAVS